MERWRADARGRRRGVFALALLAHAALVGGMLATRVRIDAARGGRVVEATIWTAPPPPAPPPRVTSTPPPPSPRATRLRALPGVAVPGPQAIVAPLLEAQAASAAAPPASAASEPLRLSLSRDQLRAVIAGTKPTLAQSLARGPAPSALSRLAGDGAEYEEATLPGGVTEVRVHGGCFHTVPSARSQYDPFNHGNEHLTASCK